jgi:hypothetical protein
MGAAKVILCPRKDRHTMDERRKHVRFTSATIMQYKDGIFSSGADTVTKDVSLGGVCFFSEKHLKVGQMIKLKLYYDNKTPARSLKGKITWSTPCQDNVAKGYLNGMTFVR